MARSAYEYALNLLSARAYTVRNMRRKLMQKEFDSAETDAALERLIAGGLLDDNRFAAEYARLRLAHGGRSVRRVQQELARKGIEMKRSRAAIERVKEEEPLDIERAIDHLARKKLLLMGDLEPTVQRRRLFAFLVRRGFELDDIKRAIANNLPSR